MNGLLKGMVPAVLLVSLFGCGNGSHHSHHSGSAGSSSSQDGLLLVNSAGGMQQLGSFTLMNNLNTAESRQVYEYPGKQWFQPEFQDNARWGGFTYNPVDKKFYAYFYGGGFWQAGALVSFDLAADKMEVLQTYPVQYFASGGFPIGGMYKPPVVTPDGKGLLLVAQSGGRETLPAVPNAADLSRGGDGGLLYINIDKGSAHYTQMTPVYEFYSNSNGSLVNGLTGVETRPVLGKMGGDDAIYLVAEGRKWNINSVPYQINGQAFALKPTDTNDWSRPWSYFSYFHYNQAVNGLVAQRTLYDSNNGFTVGTAAYHQSIMSVTNGEPWGATHTLTELPISSECYSLEGIMQIRKAEYLLVCAGYEEGTPGFDGYNLDPKLMAIPESNGGEENTISGNEVPVYTFNHWQSAGIKPFAFSENADQDVVVINAGELEEGPGSILGTYFFQGWGKPGGISSRVALLKRMSPTFYSEEDVLVGNNDIGHWFTGAPVLDEAARYVLQLGVFGGDYGMNTIVKHDRQTGETSHVSLGVPEAAYPFGRPITLANGKVMGSLRIGGLYDIYKGMQSPDYQGMYVMDPAKPSQPTNVASTDLLTVTLKESVSGRRVPGIEYTQLSNGDVWSVAKFNGVSGTIVYRINGATVTYPPSPVENTDYRVFGYSSTTSVNDLPQTLAAQGDNLLFFAKLEPEQDAQETGDGDRMWCAQSGDLTEAKFTLLIDTVAGNDEAHLPVYGATYSSVQDKLYLLTAKVDGNNEGRIHEVDVSNCSASQEPEVTAVVDGLTDIPSTKLIEASNGLMYYGTTNGKLMQFNPVDNSYAEVADVALASPESSAVKGYLEEGADGVLMFIVNDSDAANLPKARRLVSVKLADGSVSSTDVSMLVHSGDIYPGVSRVSASY